MIRSKCCFFLFLEVPFLAFFSLTHKEEEVWPDGTHHMLFAESSYICMLKFRSVAPFFFLAKVPFWLFFFFFFFLILEGVWLYSHAHDVPLVTLILNICGFVGVAPFFFVVKVQFLFCFVLIQKGVWPYKYAHDFSLVILILNIMVSWI